MHTKHTQRQPLNKNKENLHIYKTHSSGVVWSALLYCGKLRVGL